MLNMRGIIKYIKEMEARNEQEAMNKDIAIEILRLLNKYKALGDTLIAFNGVRISNNYDGFEIEENFDVKKWMEFCNEDTITMAFEGRMCDLMNFYTSATTSNKFISDFNKIITKYDLYYEQGHHWNLSLYN